MFEWCRKNITAIEFIFVSLNEVESHIMDYSLEERYLMWLRLSGTRSFQCYKPFSKTSLQMHRVSSDDVTISNGKQPTQKATVTMGEHQPGKYIACL